jgi:hypothetical protein
MFIIIQRLRKIIISEVEVIFATSLINGSFTKGTMTSMKNNSWLAKKLQIAGLRFLKYFQNLFKEPEMHTKSKKMLILLGFLLTFLTTRAVLADIGAKPTMDFVFTQEFSGDQLTILGGTLMECEQSDCSDGEPLATMGPQQFDCTETSCSALAYGFKTYHRLEIQFSDGKTRQSNVFKTDAFNGKYTVAVRQDDLLVKPQFSIDILPYIGCLLAVVAVVLVILLIVRRTAKKK